VADQSRNPEQRHHHRTLQIDQIAWEQLFSIEKARAMILYPSVVAVLVELSMISSIEKAREMIPWLF